MLRARCGLPRDNGPEHQSNNGMNFLAAYPFLDTSLVAFWAPFSKMVGMMFSEELYRSLHYLTSFTTAQSSGDVELQSDVVQCVGDRKSLVAI